MIEHLLIGLETFFALHNVLFAVFGVILGIMIGAIPGLSPSMGVALLVPISFTMEPTQAFIFFVAVYQAANYGGSITAIAINAPGTPSSVVTAFDGYALTKQGKPGVALGIAVLTSSIGGLIGAVVLILFASTLATWGLKFGPPEYFSLAILGLSSVIAFSDTNWIKAAAGTLLGLFISTIGTDPFSGAERFTFGFTELSDGISFIPAMIGFFALSEIFSQVADKSFFTKLIPKNLDAQAKLPKFTDILKIKKTIFRSSILGTLIGIIPGAGATIASFISYGQAKNSSKEPEKFGHGSLEGIAASEAANSSSVGGALVPLLALGIPGSATNAVLLGALTLHGLVAGPELFQKSPDLVYGIFTCLFFANFLILFFGLLGNKLWLRVIKIPQNVLFPLILTTCVIGSFTVKNSLVDAWICIICGILGYYLKKLDFKMAPIVLGLVLGPMIETNLRRTLIMGGFGEFVSSPIALSLIAVSVFSCLYPIVKRVCVRK